jgi:serine/threonine protein kinase/WD40 repeat protein
MIAGVDRLGDFRILRVIGYGGMGIVYEALQESLGRRVALKILPSQHLLDPRQLQRFQREARSAARLHHTNIVAVHGVGEQDGVHYYVMQYIQGQGLDLILNELRRLPGDRVKNAGPIATLDFSPHPADRTQSFPPAHPPHVPSFVPLAPPDRGALSARVTELTGQPDNKDPSSHPKYWQNVARIGSQVADALAYAHGQGILHRDIKPSNLLLDEQGTVWVTDFGLAKAMTGESNLTQTGDIVGTLNYMAPERFNGQGDSRSDVYALGLTLYELLTLSPAFEEADHHKLILRIAHDEPVRPRKRNPAIPRALETIVLKCIARDPAQRYATAGELADDLRRFLNDRPIRARRVSEAEKLRLWCKRYPAVAGLLAAVLALVVAVAVVSSVAAVQYRSQFQRAQAAERDGQAKLWLSYLAQARASRRSGQQGQRFETLRAIREALHLPLPEGHSRAELRTEAIAALALLDVEPELEFDMFPLWTELWNVDPSLEFYTRSDHAGRIDVCRFRGDTEVAAVQGGEPGLFPMLSPGGSYLASIPDWNGTLRVWRLESVRKGDATQSRVPFSNRLLAGDRAVQIHEQRDVKRWAVSFSPDGRHLGFVKLDERIGVFDLDLEQLRWLPRSGGSAWHIAFSPDGRRLAMRLERQRKHFLQVRDIYTGEITHEIPIPGGLDIIVWHPDGQRICSIGNDRRFRIWELATGRELLVLEPIKALGSNFTFDRQGDHLYGSDWDHTLRVWDAQTGRLIFRMPDVVLPCISPENHLLGTRVQGEQSGRLHLEIGREYRTLPVRIQDVETQAEATLIHPDGRLLAAASPEGLTFYDLARGQVLATIPIPGTRPLQFTPDGTLLSFAGLGVCSWPITRQVTSSGEVFRVGPPRMLGPYLQNERPGASTDGSVLAIPNFSAGSLLLRRDHAYQPLVLAPQQDARFCAVSPDGHWVATANHGSSHDAAAKIWDARSGAHVADLPGSVVGPVGFSPDGRWLMTTGGGCRLWEVGSWREHRVLGGNGFAFSPDQVSVALSDDMAIRLVRLATGEELARLEAPQQDSRTPLCFSPDGARLVIVDQERTRHVWDLRAVRRQLSDLGLDWDAPPFPPPVSAETTLRVQVELGGIRPAARLDSGRVLFGLAAATQPLHPESHRRLGIILENQGELEQARAAYSRAIILQPRRADLYARRGWCEYQLGLGLEALADLQRAVSLAPEDRVACRQLAWFYLWGPAPFRAPEQALALAHRLVQDPSISFHHLVLGVARYRLGRWEEALDAFAKGIEVRRGEATSFYFYLQAICHHHLGNKVYAEQLLAAGDRWLAERRQLLSAADLRELAAVRAEARAVLELP